MYSVHYPSYDKILDILSKSETHSAKTSSLPLADFWHPERNKNQKNKLCQEMGISLGDLNPQMAEYSFEYPTPAYENKESQKVIDLSI